MIAKFFIALIMTGWASQYAPGVMESVLAVRSTPGRTSYTVPQDLSIYDGFVATRDCDRLGEELLIKPQDQSDYELFLVTDCSGHITTTQWMNRNNIIVEVDYNTAVRWDTIGRGIKIDVAKKLTVSRYLILE